MLKNLKDMLDDIVDFASTANSLDIMIFIILAGVLLSIVVGTFAIIHMLFVHSPIIIVVAMICFGIPTALVAYAKLKFHKKERKN